MSDSNICFKNAVTPLVIIILSHERISDRQPKWEYPEYEAKKIFNTPSHSVYTS